MPLLPARSSTARAVLPPHPVLRSYYTDRRQQRAFLSRVFDRSAANYDRIETLMALGSGRWYRRRALRRAGLAPGMRVLDVAVGTGLVAREAIGIVGDPRLVIGLDPSPAMIHQAIRLLGIGAVLGIGERIPLLDAGFDFVSMGYALRHLDDLHAAFSEFHRVLKPAGRICILEIARPRFTPHRWALRAYLRHIVPAMARFASHGGDSALLWKYYWDTIDSCIPPQTVVECLRSCGFANVRHRMELGMFAEYTATRATADP
ncbi:class I SAM-dependent methyltransferase [Fontivita pretiosa]|uniref:class I SAM-dependent methyltransferase n=1 Tax=Fontivita pretiosa TaxID=2989684 RepID=UPI003D180ABC